MNPATYHRGQRDYGTGYDMMARIEDLEAGITAALRERDDDMRPILREALHGRKGCK
jgi:hypothetical protein